MRLARWILSATLLIAVFTVAIALHPGPATGYERYNANNGDGGCAQCHPGFIDRGPAHGAHSGSNDPAADCSYCHKSIGDNPLIGESGNDPDFGCNGCHTGVGLRAHHANAGAPEDNAGDLCAACHQNDPTPPGEDAVPAFYGRVDINVTDPCRRLTANGGEDFDGDGKGLDNDGDLLYDFQDPDCAFVPTEQESWSAWKAIFR